MISYAMKDISPTKKNIDVQRLIAALPHECGIRIENSKVCKLKRNVGKIWVCKCFKNAASMKSFKMEGMNYVKLISGKN